MLNSAGMALTKEQMLEEAVQAGQRGDSAAARELLLKLLRLDNREPLYWLLMSTAVESREERIYCLHNVLFLDPDNSAAKHDLELLGAEVPQVDTPAFVPEEKTDWQTTEIAAPKIRKRKKKQKEEPWSTSWVLGSLAVGVVIIVLGYYAAQQGLIPGLVDTPTPGPGTRVAPTATPTAGTPQPTSTRQISVAPRDPQELLQATYTATPRYLATPHAESQFGEALAAYDAGDWATAAELFSQYLASNPQTADAAYYLGQSRLALGDAALAQAAFEQAISLNPQFAYGYLGRARALIAQQGNTANILTDLNTSLLLDPNLIEGYLERAEFNLNRANPNQALEDVSAAETLEPRNALVQYYKSRVYLVRGENELALQAAERAYELDLTLLPNYLAIVRAQLALGEYDAAIETALGYLGFAGSDGQGWELLGIGYQLNEQHDLALEAFQRALDIDPNLPSAAYYRGVQELEAGQNEAALGDFRIAVLGRADWFEARIYLAQAHLATGNPSAAFFEINAGAPLAETDFQRGLLFYWRATALEALSQPENARPDWLSLLALPEDAVPAEWRAEAEDKLAP